MLQIPHFKHQPSRNNTLTPSSENQTNLLFCQIILPAKQANQGGQFSFLGEDEVEGCYFTSFSATWYTANMVNVMQAHKAWNCYPT